MLPSISAELPAYLVPPTGRGTSTATTSDAPQGATGDRVELAVDRAIDVQSKKPDAGLYGPDGRFVNAAPQASRGDGRGGGSGTGYGTDARNLTLDEINALVPPAAREELRALADRVEKKKTAKELSPEDYRRISELMERIGRHGEAKDALQRAQELEASTQPSSVEARMDAEAKAIEQSRAASEVASKEQSSSSAETLSPLDRLVGGT